MLRPRVLDRLHDRPRFRIATLFLAVSIVATGCSDGSVMDNAVKTPPGGKPPEPIEIKPNVAPKKASAKAEPI